MVNERDEVIGGADKLKTHQAGLLHRAFSIFIFNFRGELLLQKRAQGKYHSAGLWSNTCCSHQGPGESLSQAAAKRLKEEMGLACDLEEVLAFRYLIKFPNGLIENELDHVFIGFTDKKPEPNPEEAADYKYLSLKALKQEIKVRPDDFTGWLKIIVKKYSTRLAFWQRKN